MKYKYTYKTKRNPKIRKGETDKEFDDFIKECDEQHKDLELLSWSINTKDGNRK